MFYKSYTHNALYSVAESKNTTPRTNFYPNGIYINANGIKGHYITKEIKDNHGRSKIHQLHNIQKFINWNNTFNSMS